MAEISTFPAPACLAFSTAASSSVPSFQGSVCLGCPILRLSPPARIIQLKFISSIVRPLLFSLTITKKPFFVNYSHFAARKIRISLLFPWKISNRKCEI